MLHVSEYIEMNEDNTHEADLSYSIRHDKVLYTNSNIYLPNQPITIDITYCYENQHIYDKNNCHDIENNEYIETDSIPHGSYILSDKSCYDIQISHGNYQWKISRKLSELKIFHALFSLQRAYLFIAHQKRAKINPFPPTLDFMLENKSLNRRVMLKNYLQSIVNVKEYRESDVVLRFLEISPLSFIERLGNQKFKEDLIYKLPSHRCYFDCCLKSNFFLQKRWLVLKETYFAYLQRKGNFAKRKNTHETSEENKKSKLYFGISHFNRCWRLSKVFLIDQNFAFKIKNCRGGNCHELKLYNSLGRLAIVCQSESRMQEWYDTLLTHIYRDGTKDYIQYNRFGSFAPPRKDTHVSVFVDGACYMESVAKAIAQAQHEIFITDWCMDPYIYLRRPVKDNTWRLDKLLLAKAKQGVQICIMLYKEFEKAANFRSTKTKQYLCRLHKNIHIYRSPQSLRLWSHHEKMVAVDQSIVYLGGIDLCFGRWDNVHHRLQDIYTTEDGKRLSIQSQKIRTHYRRFSASQNQVSTAKAIRKASQVQTVDDMQLLKSMIKMQHPTLFEPKCRRPQLPASFNADVGGLKSNTLSSNSSQTKEDEVVGTTNWNADCTKQRSKSRAGIKISDAITKAGTAMCSLVHRISMAGELKSHNRHYSTALPFCETEWGNYNEEDENYVFDNVCYEDDLDAVDQTKIFNLRRFGPLDNLVDLAKGCTWVGQDYVNWNIQDPLGKHHPALDLVDRNNVPRTPWHDVGCVVTGNIATDLSRHFIQRWNQIRAKKIRSCKKGFSKRSVQRLRPCLLPCSPSSPWTENKLSKVLLNPYQSTTCCVQALRSVSNWSLGVPSASRKGIHHKFRELFNQNLPAPTIEDLNMIDFSNEIGLEKSIANAYLDLIQNAQHYIYIENQFFISYILSKPEDTDNHNTSNTFKRSDLSSTSDSKKCGRNSNNSNENSNSSELTKSTQGEMNPADMKNKMCNITPTDDHNSSCTNNTATSTVLTNTTTAKRPILKDLRQARNTPTTDVNSNTVKIAKSPPPVLEGVVKNRIVDALYFRILQAYNEGAPFRVYIMIPLIAAFTGQVGTSSGTTIHLIMHYIRLSLFTGDHALIPRLKQVMPNPENYVSICSLRTYDKWPNEKFKSEPIYIHSKLMIVDDCKLIIGSANLNDRSMLGLRDSELAVLIETNSPDDLVERTFANQPVKVHPFVRRLRRSLMAEYLGMLGGTVRESVRQWSDEVLSDPVCDEFFHGVWNATAKMNEQLFDEIFHCTPTSGLRTFKDCANQRKKKYLFKTEAFKAFELLKQIKGYLVTYPSDFLADESLVAPVGTVERILPDLVWI